jgi:hypothetical protein
MSDDPLIAVLDILLPGGEGFPAASAIDLASWLRARGDFAPVVPEVLAALPGNFAAAPVAALRAIEALPAFDRLVVGAYSGYYVHPAVLEVIAQHTGYPARPPQPEGYDLTPFDPSLLAQVRLRGHGYRG